MLGIASAFAVSLAESHYAKHFLQSLRRHAAVCRLQWPCILGDVDAYAPPAMRNLPRDRGLSALRARVGIRKWFAAASQLGLAAD